jgi:putative FmdB family regulatory protein
MRRVLGYDPRIMPIYEYRCADCSHRFEILQRMGENGDGLACPECGARKVEKQLSTFAAATASSSSSFDTGGEMGSCGGGSCGGPGCGLDF